MRVFCVCCFLLQFSLGYGQRVVKGIVVDATVNKALPNARVFLNGTSFSTTTNEQGRFSFSIPPGKYNFVAACNGFDLQAEMIDASKLADSITVRLQPKSISYNKEGGYKKAPSGQLRDLFQKELLGATPYTDNCQIKNIRAVDFYLVNGGQAFVAVADEPLMIENRALGYTVYFQLESFQSDGWGSLSYSGYTYFRPLDGSTSRIQQWQDARAAAYYGSITHFMRSVYLNKISEEGFEVRHMRKVLNLQPVTPADSSSSKEPLAPGTGMAKLLDKDSVADYRDQVWNPDNYKEIISAPITGDSIAYAIDKTTAALDFSDFLLVTYRNKDAPAVYETLTGSSAMMSQLLLPNGRPVAVEANGSYYDAADLLLLDYWLWAGRIPMLLPYDYVPIISDTNIPAPKDGQ